MNWYVRGNDGDETNSGDSDAAAAALSVADFVVSGTGFSSVTGGFTGMAGRAVNIQVGGNSEIRLLSTVTDDNSGTISAAPSAGDGTYSAKVGGARASINRVANTGANNNSVLVAADTVWVRPKTGGYNELVNLNQNSAYKSLGGQVTVDGTGLGAGSDPITYASNGALHGFKVTGAVDIGIARTSGNMIPVDCVVVSPGTVGIARASNTLRTSFCTVSGATIGIQGAGSAIVEGCQVSGCSTNGVTAASFLSDTLIYECAIGYLANANAQQYIVTGNSFLYSTGDGMEIDATSRFSLDSVFMNNLVAFNGGYGVDSSAGAQDNRYTARKNHYYLNTTAATRNFNADEEGYEGPTGDPLFISAAGDDYRLQPSSPDAGTALGPAKLHLSVGAVPVINDYPAAGDVQESVTYAGATLTGTLELPAESEVENGVGFGAGGTEFTGTLIGGGKMAGVRYPGFGI